MDVIGDRFELLAVAGAGGMGTVHRARDRRTGELVAVKVLSPRGRSDVERFEREAELLAELRHPAIVRYVAHGVASAGQPYLAMEWLEGEDLSQRLARGPLTVDEAIALGDRVASALGFSHERGVVHRDVKPSNVFLSGGDVASARVLDFGVARLAGGARGMTRTGMVVGTPGYMAPEQARGDRQIDVRADVFALGCVLYEAMTGVPAFFAENLLALLARIVLEDPRPPGELCAMPRDLEALLMRMLSKDPKARPRDGAAVVEALARVPPVSTESLAPKSALGDAEQEWVSLVFARDPAHLDTAQADTLAAGDASPQERVAAVVSPLGVELARLLDGTLVLRDRSSAEPREGAVRAARAAMAARAALGPDAKVVLVTGRGLRGARAPLGRVIDQGAALLAHAASRGGPRLDSETAALLEARFHLGSDAHGRTLGGELPADEAPRRLLGQPSVCVGRDRELGNLVGLFDECVSEGLARAVLVTAPAGAGKSRLRRELAARLGGRGEIVPMWLARADVMSAGSPNGLLMDVARSALGLAEGEPGAPQRTAITTHVARRVAAAEVPRVAAFLGELVGVPFPEEGLPALRGARRDPIALGDQIAAAWDDFLAAELSAGPVVIVVEDLHWGDRGTVRALDRALRRMRELPLFVLATARPEVHELFPSLWAGRDVQELRLTPLSPRAAERLVRGALGTRATDDMVARIVSRAEGNAFVLEELVRAAATDGSDGLPETVLAMTAARLAALGDEARRVLRAASVFGEVFWHGGVEALTGSARVDEVLREIIEREVIEERPPSRFDGQWQLCFRHALLRDAAYAALTPDGLAVGHRLAASWLERAGEHDALTIAEHHERGGDLAAAATFLARAAARALETNDFDATVRLARRALDAGGGEAGAATCHRLIADAEQWRGRYQEAVEAAREAVALSPPGSAAWYRALMLEAISVQRLAGWSELPPLAERALAATPLPDAAEVRIEVMVRLAMRLQFCSQSGPAIALLDAVAATSLAAPDESAQAWLAAAAAVRAHVAGDLPTYLHHIDRAGQLLIRAGNLRDALSQMEDQGWWLQHCGHYDRALDVITRVIEEAERLGLRRVEINARLAQVLQRISAGHPDVGVREAEALLAALPPDSGDVATARLFLLWTLASNGEWERAYEIADKAVASLLRGGGYWRVARARQLDTLVALGKLDEVEEPLSDLLAVMDAKLSGAHFDVEGRCSATSALLALGRRDEAAEQIRRTLTSSRGMIAGFTDEAAREMATRTVVYHARAHALARELGVE